MKSKASEMDAKIAALRPLGEVTESAILNAVKKLGIPIAAVEHISGTNYRLSFDLDGGSSKGLNAGIAASCAVQRLVGGPVDVKFHWMK